MANDPWSVGGRSLTPEQERAAWQAIDDAGGTDAFEIVVLSGSIVAGLGHELSDLDLYAVAAKGVEVDMRKHGLEGVPVQLNMVPRTLAVEMCELFGEYQVTAAERHQIDMLPGYLKPLSRLVFGRPMYVSPAFEQVYGQCDRDDIRRLYLTYYARQVSRMAEDAYGGLLADDPLVACQAAEMALRFGAEAALSGCGDVFVGESYFWRRLARVDHRGDLARSVWRLLREGPPWGAPAAAVRASVTDTVALATHLSGHAQLDGWDSPMVTPPEPRAPASDSLRRNPFFAVLRFGETVGLVGPAKAYRSNHTTARLWLAAESEPTDAAVVGRFVEMGLLLEQREVPREVTP